MPPPPVERNVFEMTGQERRKEGIGTLLGNLYEPIELAENSELVRKALGEHVFNIFIQNREAEWDRYRIHVTDYEIAKYLPIL